MRHPVAIVAPSAIFPFRLGSPLQRSYGEYASGLRFAALGGVGGIRAANAANPGTPRASAAIRETRAASAPGTAQLPARIHKSALTNFAGDRAFALKALARRQLGERA